eukprot:g3160.t1
MPAQADLSASFDPGDTPRYNGDDNGDNNSDGHVGTDIPAQTYYSAISTARDKPRHTDDDDGGSDGDGGEDGMSGNDVVTHAAGEASDKQVLRRSYSAPPPAAVAPLGTTATGQSRGCSRSSSSPPRPEPCSSAPSRLSPAAWRSQRKEFPVLFTHAGWLKWDWDTALYCASTESRLYS